MNWNLMFQPFRKYATFTGRARRSEYWLFILFQIVVTIVLMLLTGGFATATDPSAAAAGVGGLSIIVTLFSLAVLLPTLACAVRRLHDTNRSGWWVLLGIVPIANIVLLVFFATDGTAGANQYGPDPKGRDLAQTFA